MLLNIFMWNNFRLPENLQKQYRKTSVCFPRLSLSRSGGTGVNTRDERGCATPHTRPSSTCASTSVPSLCQGPAEDPVFLFGTVSPKPPSVPWQPALVRAFLKDSGWTLCETVPGCESAWCFLVTRRGRGEAPQKRGSARPTAAAAPPQREGLGIGVARPWWC